jgi:hypothetical protein
MPALTIRDDIGSEELRRRARRERDGRLSARLIAIANALEGMDRASAARLAGMDRQTLRDWVSPLRLACALPCRRFAGTLRVPTHGLRPRWFATPSSWRTCTPIPCRSPGVLRSSASYHTSGESCSIAPLGNIGPAAWCALSSRPRFSGQRHRLR